MLRFRPQAVHGRMWGLNRVPIIARASFASPLSRIDGRWGYYCNWGAPMVVLKWGRCVSFKRVPGRTLGPTCSSVAGQD